MNIRLCGNASTSFSTCFQGRSTGQLAVPLAAAGSRAQGLRSNVKVCAASRHGLLVDEEASASICISRRASMFGMVFSGLALVARPALATPASEAVDAIKRDFQDKQYYVTGNVTRELFADDCVFKDPTVEVVGVEPYVKALQTLFEPATSRADLISLQVTGPTTVALRWRLEGSLKIGGLKIKPYTGTTVYTISDGGKVVRHEETWDISTLDAFVSTFIPSFGAPPAPPVVQ